MKVLSKVIFVIILNVASCKSEPIINNEKFIREKINKEFIFPKQVEIIYPEFFLYDSIAVFNSTVKLVTYIDFDCGECYNELNELKDFINNFDNNKVSLIVYGYTEESMSGYYAFTIYYPNFPFPIFVDIKKEYLKINNIPIDNRLLHTFLINKNGKIHIIGSPLSNNSHRELYISEIGKMLSK